MSTWPHPVHDRLVCSTCFGLRAGCDHCRCTYPEGDKTVREAEGLVACTICAACGLGLARGHSRWRVNYCGRCQPAIQGVRRLLGWPIPLGIHSIVNQLPTLSGDDLRAADISDEARVLFKRKCEQFADGLNAMSASIGSLYGHCDELVRTRFGALGLSGDPGVPVLDYFAACRAAGIDDDAGWASMLRHFGFGDWIDDVAVYRSSLATPPSGDPAP